MLTVGFSFPGQSIQASFETLAKDIKDLRVPFEHAAQEFEKDMIQQFDRQGRSPKWEKLSDMTLAIRQHHDWQERGIPAAKSSGRILFVKGNLMRSFTNQGSEGHVRTIEPLRLLIGSNLSIQTKKGPKVLGELHTEGYDIPVSQRMRIFFGLTYGIWIKKKVLHVPDRPVMRVSAGATKNMMDYVTDYIKEIAGVSLHNISKKLTHPKMRNG